MSVKRQENSKKRKEPKRLTFEELRAENEALAVANHEDMSRFKSGGRWLNSNGKPPKEVVAVICRRLVMGETLKNICDRLDDGFMPRSWTVYQWTHRFPKFREAFFLAKEFHALDLEDQIFDIASALDPEKHDRDAAYVADVKIKAFTALMRIKNPKRYSEKFQLPDGLQGDVEIRFRVPGEPGKEGQAVPPSDKVIDTPFEVNED